MRNKGFGTALSCIIAALVLWAALVVFPEFPGQPTGDTLSQLEQVHNHCINNWKPALYAYLLMLGEYLFTSGGIKLGYLAQCLLFALGFGMMVLSLCQISNKYLFLLVLLPFFGTRGCMITTVGNDAMAAACFVAFIGFAMFSRMVSSTFWRYTVLIVGLFLLWYGMAMRHNSFFCVTALLTWLFWSLSHSFKKAVCLAITSALLFLILNFSILGICHVEKSYPLKSAFADDLVNISILNGTWDPFCIEKQKQTNNMLASPNEVAELAPDVCNFYPSGLSPYENIRDSAQREQDYEEYKNSWVRCVTENPVKYITLKAFFFHQYLMAGRSIPLVNSYIKYEFPHASIKHDGLYSNWRHWCGALYVFNALIPMLSYIATIVMILRVIIKKAQYDIVVKDALFILSANILYTVTFSIFTLSATEERYYIITSSLSLIGTALLILSIFVKKGKTV